MAQAPNTAAEQDSDVIEVELTYSKEQLSKLIEVLPGNHPLVIDLRRQLERAYDSVNNVREKRISSAAKLTYLAEKLKVSSVEQLLSKALSLLNMGLQLEERGYEVVAVKHNFFSKELFL